MTPNQPWLKLSYAPQLAAFLAVNGAYGLNTACVFGFMMVLFHALSILETPAGPPPNQPA